MTIDKTGVAARFVLRFGRLTLFTRVIQFRMFIFMLEDAV